MSEAYCKHGEVAAVFFKGGDPMDKPDTSIVQFVSFTIDPEKRFSKGTKSIRR